MTDRRIRFIAFVIAPFWILCACLGLSHGASAQRVEAAPATPVGCVAPAPAPGSGMRINPCAELDTTQVQDDRAGAAGSDVMYLVGDGDMGTRTFRELQVIGYQHPEKGKHRDHFLVAWSGGTEEALDRIHSGINM